jgi:hypothetical protein
VMPLFPGVAFTLEATNDQTFDTAVVFGAATITADSTLQLGDGFSFSGGSIPNSASLTVGGDTVINHGTIHDASQQSVFAGISQDGAISFQSTDFENFANSTDIRLACFAAGTRLATARGMVAVEALSEGDIMLLASRDGSLPVVWIGHRTVECLRHPAPRAVWPVRIAADAFAHGVPKRDVYLSPDHAVFVRGVLIPVKYLVNGTTIAQVRVDRVQYWHVELARHAVLLADGLSVESLLRGDRSAFANGDGVVALQYHWAREGLGCAPLIVSGPHLDAVRVTLQARARSARRTDAMSSSRAMARQEPVSD